MAKTGIYSPELGCIGLESVKVGRNDQCPCGSGKKAKKCCGAETKYRNRDFENISDLKIELKYWEKERDALMSRKGYNMPVKLAEVNKNINALTKKIETIKKLNHGKKNEEGDPAGDHE